MKEILLTNKRWNSLCYNSMNQYNQKKQKRNYQKKRYPLQSEKIKWKVKKDLINESISTLLASRIYEG